MHLWDAVFSASITPTPYKAVSSSLQFGFNRVNASSDPNIFFHEHAMAGYLVWALYKVDKHFLFALWAR